MHYNFDNIESTNNQQHLQFNCEDLETEADLYRSWKFDIIAQIRKDLLDIIDGDVLDIIDGDVFFPLKLWPQR